MTPAGQSVTLLPRFQNRAFADIANDRELRLVVNSLEWDAIGGPVQASITAYGPEMNLWNLIEYLRYPVAIGDERDDLAWWGLVDEARVRVGAVEVGASLGHMSNRVAVAYSYIEPGSNVVGTRKTTAWAQDDDAVAEYGIKEWLSSASGLTDAAALARRAAILAQHKWPGGAAQSFGMPRGRVRSSGAENSQSASLICRGWMSTLGWKYASVGSVAGPAYTATSTEQAFGNAAATTRVFQQVLVGAQAINLLSIQVYVRKQAAPGDNLVVGLYALDANGVPTGSALASASTAGSGLGTSLAWLNLAVTEMELAANTLYGLQVSRSGANDGTNYYAVGCNAALGYTGGYFRIWNGSAWVARGTDADMLFQLMVNNKVETTTQIRDLATVYGQWVTGIDVDAASTVFTGSYRDGDTTALQEIEELLQLGGANGRRLLAEMDRQRRLHVY